MTRKSIYGLLMILLALALVALSFAGCGDDDDDDDDNGDAADDDGNDDDTSDDDDAVCEPCFSTSECTEKFGFGWGCSGGCCVDAGNLADDDDATIDDDDAIDDDDVVVDDDDAVDDDDTVDDDDVTDDDDVLDDDDVSEPLSSELVYGGSLTLDICAVELDEAADTVWALGAKAHMLMLYKRVGAVAFGRISTGSYALFADLALDSSKNPVVAFVDPIDFDLRVGTYIGTTWSEESTGVTLMAGITYSLSLTVDGSDHVHIGYTDASTGAAEYVTNASGSWVKSTAFSGTVISPYGAMMLDSNGKVHFAIVADSYVWYGTNASGSWAFDEVVAAANTDHVSMTLDGSDVPYLAYAGAAGLSLAIGNDEKGWDIAAIDSTANCGKNSRILIDDDGFVHIIYRRSTYYIYHADNSDGSFATARLNFANTKVGSRPDLVVASDGYLHITNIDYSTGFMKYARYTTAFYLQIDVDTVQQVTGTFYGDYANQSLHLVLYDDTINEYQYLSDSGSGWVVEGGDFPSYMHEVLVDEQGNLHCLNGNYDLYYSVYIGGVWVNMTLDTAGTYTGDAIMTLGKDDNVYLAYKRRYTSIYNHAFTRNQLWFMEQMIETPDIEEFDGAADSQGRFYVLMNTPAGLLAFDNSSGLWTSSPEQVDIQGDTGHSPKIVMDRFDVIHGIYYEQTLSGNTLKYVTNAGGNYSTETIDATGGYSGYGDVVVDKHGNTHVVFGDELQQRLMYAGDESGSWEVVDMGIAYTSGEVKLVIDDNSVLHVFKLDLEAMRHISFTPDTL